MTARRLRLARECKPRGAWLAFLALAMQVLVPFFMAVEIARADGPGAAAVICSALEHSTHQGSGNTGDQGLGDHCSICTTLAAAHAFAPPGGPPLPLPLSVGRTFLAASDTPQATLLVTSSYQSQGPPSIT
jgi:hypothetical protein